ncbi:MAG TPA: hypothetical protein VMF64_00385 [Steroidobacteraceae bacterium]|nr:hypothetical protein [Steroidobacteraceae bacterium]
MAALHLKEPGSLRSSGPALSAWGLIALLLGWSGVAPAQPGADATPAPGADIMIRSSVAGSTPWAEPGPSTAVPKWAQQSYRIYLQMKARANGGANRDADHMPDWSGLWTVDGSQGFTWDGPAVDRLARGLGPKSAQALLDHCWKGDTPEFPCKGWLLAALTPQYALRFREKLAAVTRDIEWDPLSDCLPPGFPRGALLDPFGRELIVTPKETWMTSQTLNDIRRIYTDGRGHTPIDESYPLWDGDSIGFWDGDTLVVHTLYVLSHVEMQRLQPSLSDEASFVERIKMTGPDTIEDDATIYDPLALRQPWHSVIRFVRQSSPHNHVNMYACDPNVYQTAQGGTDIILPGGSVTMKREYRDPSDVQEIGVDKVIEYGAKVLKGEAPKAPARP